MHNSASKIECHPSWHNIQPATLHMAFNRYKSQTSFLTYHLSKQAAEVSKIRQTGQEGKELSQQITESSELQESLVPLSSFVWKTFFFKSFNSSATATL